MFHEILASGDLTLNFHSPLQAEEGPEAHRSCAGGSHQARFKVSARNLGRISPIWDEIIYNEQTQPEDGSQWKICVRGGSELAWEIFLHLCHSHDDNPLLGVCIDLTTLFHVTSLASQYHCMHILKGHAQKWLHQLQDTFANIGPSDSFLDMALWTTFELGHQELFSKIAENLAKNSCLRRSDDIYSCELDGRKLNVGHVVTVLDTIVNWRENTMQSIQDIYEEVVDQALSPSFNFCYQLDDTDHCSLYLTGLLVQSLARSGLPFPHKRNLFEIMSVNQAIKKISALGQGSWQGSRHPTFHWACLPVWNLTAKLNKCMLSWPPVLLPEHLAYMKERAGQTGLH